MKKRESKYEAIRTEIKNLAKLQPVYRKQRKSDKHITVDRIMTPSKAISSHLNGKWELMHLYMAYQVLKGKEMVTPTRKDYSQSKIDAYVSKFKPVEIQAEDATVMQE